MNQHRQARMLMYLLHSARREMHAEYVGSLAGVLWNILRPLGMLLIYSIILGQMFTRSKAAYPELPYWAFLCAALLPWQAFSRSISRGTAGLSGSRPSTVCPVPEELVVGARVLAEWLTVFVGLLVLAVFLVFVGVQPSIAWLSIVVPVGLFGVFAFGIGLVFSVLNVFFRDVRHLVSLGLQVGFWSVPICYDAAALSDRVRWFVERNPIYPFIQASRRVMLGGSLPTFDSVLLMLGWAAFALLVGLLLVRLLRDSVRDVA